jgi:hypothetical protein
MERERGETGSRWRRSVGQTKASAPTPPLGSEEIGSGFGIGFVDGPGCSVVVELVVVGSHVAVWHQVYWMIAIHHHHYSKPNIVDHDRINGE